MKKAVKLVTASLTAIGVFFFAPIVPTTTANFGIGPSYSAWVSPSFALFQCGLFIGHPGIQIPNGDVIMPVSGPWNCRYPKS